MEEYYRAICELTFKYRDSKEVVVRKAVITIIPSIATYNGEQFELLFLHRSMSYLLQALGKPTDRDIGGYSYPYFEPSKRCQQRMSHSVTWRCSSAVR